MDYFPASWGLVKRSLPPLAAYAAGRLIESYRAGQRASKAIARDPPFATSTTTMRAVPTKRRRTALRRSTVYRTRYVRPRGYGGYRRIVRSAPSAPISIINATTSYHSITCRLNEVHTQDILDVYRFYRLRKVVLHLVPRVDLANSGLVNNYNVSVAAGCDPENNTAPSTISSITALDNHRMSWLTSGGVFKYSFYPKAINTVDSSGTATPVSSYGMNPWLFCNAAGVAIPHYALKLGVKTGANTTMTFDYYLEYHFDVKGFA